MVSVFGLDTTLKAPFLGMVHDTRYIMLKARKLHTVTLPAVNVIARLNMAARAMSCH